MTSDPVHYLSLIDVSARLRRGELKPTALSEVILARIAQHDGALKSGVDPVRWTVCHLGCFGFLEHLHLIGNRG